MKSTTQATEPIQTLVFTKPGHMTVLEAPSRALKTGEFRVSTVYSGVSAGTELSFYNGTNFKAIDLFDPNYRLFRKARPGEHLTDEYPLTQGGLEVGRVTASRTQKVPEGSLVAMVYGHRSSYIAHEDEYYIILPTDFDPLIGIFVAKMGPICANGILYAADDLARQPLTTLKGSLSDQRIVVFGAGIVGMLTALLAKWAGASDVVVVDGIDERLAVAEKLGLSPLKAAPDLPKILKDRWKTTNSSNRGADIAFQCTGSDILLSYALAALHEQGTVVDLGYYQTGATELVLGREFHHNNLRHLCAQIGSQPRHQPDWDRRRLAGEVITFLEEYGEALKREMITHVVNFTEAPALYQAMSQRDPAVIQVALKPNNQQ